MSQKRRERLPAHFGMGVHEWRVLKRRQFDDMLRAANAFLLGAAYTPIHWIPDLNHLETLRKALSQKAWGK